MASHAYANLDGCAWARGLFPLGTSDRRSKQGDQQVRKIKAAPRKNRQWAAFATASRLRDARKSGIPDSPSVLRPDLSRRGFVDPRRRHHRILRATPSVRPSWYPGSYRSIPSLTLRYTSAGRASLACTRFSFPTVHTPALHSNGSVWKQTRHHGGRRSSRNTKPSTERSDNSLTSMVLYLEFSIRLKACLPRRHHIACLCQVCCLIPFLAVNFADWGDCADLCAVKIVPAAGPAMRLRPLFA